MSNAASTTFQSFTAQNLFWCATSSADRLPSDLLVSDLGTTVVDGMVVQTVDAHQGYLDAALELHSRGFVVASSFTDGEGQAVDRWTKTTPKLSARERMAARRAARAG